MGKTNYFINVLGLWSGINLGSMKGFIGVFIGMCIGYYFSEHISKDAFKYGIIIALWAYCVGYYYGKKLNK